jgi:hypothetical protein
MTNDRVLPVCRRCKNTFHDDGVSDLCQDCRPQPVYAPCDSLGYMDRAFHIRIAEGFAISEEKDCQ